MKLSIMFVTRNRKKELTRAIQSCLDNRINSMEIIIVDNNSNDGTSEVVELLRDNNIEYQYYYSDTNLGVAGARNKAFELSKGEYVFSLDDDAIINTVDLFKKICNKMDGNKHIIIGALEILEPETGKILKEKTYYKKDSQYEGLRSLSFIGAAHIIRKKFFKDKYLYPQNLFFGSEELYATLSVLKEREVVAYFDDLQILHLPSKISRVAGDERLFNLILNTYIVRKLCYPRVFHPLLYVVLRIRLKKYNLGNYKNKQDFKTIYNDRYNSEESNRMSITTFLLMQKDVGLSILI